MEQVLASIVDSIEQNSTLVAEMAARDRRACGRRQGSAPAWPASMSALSRQIAAAVRENAAGAKEITRAAEKMNHLTHQMSEAVRSRSAAARWW